MTRRQHGNRFIDHTGQRFGRLLVLHHVRPPVRQRRWGSRCSCLCDCGRTVEVAARSLRNGDTTSCGCYQREHARELYSTHGAIRHPLYKTWRGIINRCTNEKQPGYARYGGRGISICDRWLNDPNAFFSDMGPKPSPRHQVDRIDNDGNYEPANCRWATRRQQCGNTRRSHRLTFEGRTLTITEWGRELGINCATLSARINKHKWPTARALTTPTARGGGRK